MAKIWTLFLLANVWVTGNRGFRGLDKNFHGSGKMRTIETRCPSLHPGPLRWMSIRVGSQNLIKRGEGGGTRAISHLLNLIDL